MTRTIPAGRAFGLTCALAAVVLLGPNLAKADFHMRSPNEIDLGEIEVEHNGASTIDKAPGKGGEASYTAEIGTGVTSWWHPEIELDISRNPGPGMPTQVQGGTWENTFQVTETDEGWVDFGLYAEYSHSSLKGMADDILFGPLFEKDIGRTTQTLNLFLSKGIGANQDSHGLDFSYAWQSRWNVWRQLSPAFEIYGDIGQIDHANAFQAQQLIAGPVLMGNALLGPLGKLKYEVGYLFGMTQASANGTVRWRMEMEIPF